MAGYPKALNGTTQLPFLGWRQAQSLAPAAATGEQASCWTKGQLGGYSPAHGGPGASRRGQGEGGGEGTMTP